MKSFFTKQLALLALLLFAGVGSAFGNSKFTFTMNDPDADAVRLDFHEEEVGDFSVLPLVQNEWEYTGEHDIVMSGVEVFNKLYSLKKLTVDGADVTETFNTGGSLSMSPTVDHTVYIELDKVETWKFNVTFSHQIVATVSLGTPNYYPSISEDGYMEVRKGDDTWLHVYQQNSAYPIKKVTLDGEDITEYFTNGNDGYLIENVSTDHNINVELKELPSNTITVTQAYDYGSVAFLNGSLYQYDNPAVLPKGQDIKMLINPNPGYRVSKVKVDGTDVTAAYNNANYSYQFTNLQADHTVEVEYVEVATHRIRVNDFDTEKGWMNIVTYWGDSGFSIFPNYEDGYYASSAGSNVRLEIYPNGDYSVKSLKVDNVDVTSQMTDGRSYEFLNLKQDHEVTVTFGDMVTVTPNYDRNLGEVYLNGIDWLPEDGYLIGEGKTVRLTVLPYDGCKISSIEVGDQTVTDKYLAKGYYDFIANASTSVFVTFVEAERYSITVNCEQGWASLKDSFNEWDASSNPSFIEGSDVMLKVQPNTGYEVETITVDGREINPDYDIENAYYYYTFENLNSDHTVNVTFNEVGMANLLTVFNENQTDLFLDNSLRSTNCWYGFTLNAIIRLKLQPHIGYEVESIMLNGEDVTENYNENDGFFDFELYEENNNTLTVTMKKKSGANEVTATIPAVGATTFCSDYDIDFNNVYGIKAYVVSGFNPDTKEALLTRVMNVPGGMGVVITGTPGDYTIPTAPTSYVYANMLRVANVPTTIWQTDSYSAWYGYCDYTNYLFDGESFNVVPEEGAEIEAYKAYMVIPTSVVGTTAPAKVSIIFEDDYDEGLITGLGFISAGQQQKGKTSDAVYDLQGRKMNAESLKAGIYIRNGKKFIVK